MRSKIIWFFLSCLMALSLVIASCAPTAEEEEEEEEGPPVEEEEEEEEGPPPVGENWWDYHGEPQYGDAITVRLPSMNPSFDPQYFRPGDTLMWFESLGHWDWTLDREVWPYTTAFVPPKYMKGLLAESWEVPDPSQAIFHIREGITWQDKPPVNGREFTAYDVEHHYHRALGTGSGYTQGSPMINFIYPNLASVTATDKYTVTFGFKKPAFGGLLEILADHPLTSIEAPEAVEMEGGSLLDWRKAVGTGPWMLADFIGGSTMTCVRNPNYWGYDERHPQNQLPYADRLRFLVMPDIATALAALRTGKIDVMSPVDLIYSDSLARTNPEIKQAEMPGVTDGVVMRVDKEPFTDINVRKALQLAIDRKTIAETYYGGAVDWKPAGIISPALKGFAFAYDDWPQELKDEYSYNPDQASQLLAEAGYPNGFKTNVICRPTSDLQLLQVIKAQFMDIGVDMEIIVKDPAAFTSFMQSKQHDQTVFYICTVAQPLGVMVNYYHSKNMSTNPTENMDLGYDAVSDSYHAALTEEEARLAVQSCDRYALEKHWVVRIVPIVNYTAYQPYLKGYSGEFLTWNGYFAYARMWIDQDLKQSMGR